jgi:hypothetical protein
VVVVVVGVDVAVDVALGMGCIVAGFIGFEFEPPPHAPIPATTATKPAANARRFAVFTASPSHRLARPDLAEPASMVSA